MLYVKFISIKNRRNYATPKKKIVEFLMGHLCVSKGLIMEKRNKGTRAGKLGTFLMCDPGAPQITRGALPLSPTMSL